MKFASFVSVAALAALSSCDGGGSGGEVKPFLVTFVPAGGEIVSVNMRRANEVYVEDRFTAGSPFDALSAAPPRTDALLHDGDTGTLAVVDLLNLSRIGLSAVIPGAVAFEAAGAAVPPSGSSTTRSGVPYWWASTTRGESCATASTTRRRVPR